MSGDVCSMSNSGCKAPAGYRTYSGAWKGTKYVRSSCVRCGDPVCSSQYCSKIRKKAKPPGRWCLDCIEDDEREKKA